MIPFCLGVTFERFYFRSKEDTINWAVPNEAFAIIESLLSIKPYQYSLLLGISISAGGITESLVHHLYLHS